MEIPQTEVVFRSPSGQELLRTVVQPGDYIIGRDPACELCVEVELLSPRHAQLTVNFDHALIEDLGSGSGTFINGKPVTECTRLWPNQKIQVGAATIELRRVKTASSSDHSLAPQTAAVRSMLPEEFLREKKYAIGGVVAQGGMGAILDAQEATTERTVAMKVMLDGSSPDDLTRFVSEAKVTAQLEHPNIVPVHELSVDENDQVFYTMKFVRGITLKKVLEEMAAGTQETIAKYPLGTLLTIFQKVCDAVAFAHSRGVIHRDLKPENLMIGDFGEVLLMDWGLAKTLGGTRSRASQTSDGIPGDQGRAGARPSEDGSGSATLAGAIMGTPQYMAPEQARGEIDALEARSDIYALGAILYHVLTLRPSVEGATIEEILDKVRTGQIVPPIQREPPARLRHATPPAAIPPASPPAPPSVDLNTPTLLQTTPAEPPVAALYDRRTTSDRQGGDAHRAPLQHLPGGSVPESLNAVVMKAMALESAARYPSVAELQADITAYQTGFATSAEHAGLGKQLVLMVKRHKGIFTTGFVAWLIITALAVWFVVNLRAKERRAVSGEQRAVAGETSAKAAEAVAVQEKEAARQSLARAARNLAEASLREGNGLAMQAALNDVPDDLRDSTWRYLFARSDTSLGPVRIGDANPSIVAAHPRLPGVFAVCDDKNKITLLEVRSGIRLLQFTPGLPPGTKGGASRMAFSPDGERLAVGGWNNEAGIVIHSTRDGKKLLHWKAPFTNRLEFSPDGKSLLQTGDNERNLSLWDAGTGELIRAYAPGGEHVHGVFTLDGRQILSAGESDGLRLVNTQDGSVIRKFSGVRGFVTSLAIGPKDMAAAADNNGFVSFYDLRDDRPVSEFRVHTAGIKFMNFTQSGEELITAVELPDGCQAISIWQPRTSDRIRSLMGGSGPVLGLGLHPLSGELLVAGSNARVWNLAGTPPRWRLPISVIPSDIAFWGSDDLLLSPVLPKLKLSVTLQTLAGRTPAVVWKSPDNSYSRPSVSADGKIAAIYSTNAPASCILLRHPGPQAEQIGSFELSKPVTLDGPASLRLSPTGDGVVAFGRRNLQLELYDTGTGQQTVAMDKKGCVRFNDLGWLSAKRFVGLVTATRSRGVSGSEEWIVLWDAATGQRLHTVKNPTAMDVLAVAPDGRHFAEAGTDKRVRIRDAETLAVQQEFRAHDDRITALAWHPTKPILATASADLSIRLWNLETGAQMDEFRGPLTAPFSLAFSPSGQRLACATVYSPTLVWEPKSLSDKPDPDKAGGREISPPQ